MDKRISLKMAGLFVGLCLFVMLSASNSSAWWGVSYGGYNHRGYNHGFYGHHGYGFYRPYYWGLNFAVTAPSIGAVVSYMPEGYTTFVINGIRYYSCDGYYFRSCPSGYVVVPAPQATSAGSTAPSQPAAKPSSEEAAPQTKATTDNSVVTINIPNSGGGFTPVKLTKYKDGYKGPQGEFYQGHPTVDELKALYGGAQ
jgi:hypothetical protein